jgi:hypothetical protein
MSLSTTASVPPPIGRNQPAPVTRRATEEGTDRPRRGASRIDSLAARCSSSNDGSTSRRSSAESVSARRPSE